MTDPRGPLAVRAALVEAAVDLFADQGDASVRAVASRAGVNHGLVHQYLGGKQALRVAVLDRLSAAIYGELEPRDGGSLRELAIECLRGTERDPRFVKILARALLDGELPEQLQTRFPVADRLRAASSVDPKLARARIAEGLALSLGAMVFGPWIRAALGLDADEFERMRASALERIFTQLDAPAPSTEPG